MKLTGTIEIFSWIAFFINHSWHFNLNISTNSALITKSLSVKNYDLQKLKVIFLVHFKTTRRHLPVIKELREGVATAGDGACWPEERGEADSAALREYSEWHGLDGKWACSSHLWFRPPQRESVPRRHCCCYHCDRRQLAAVHKSCEVCRGRRVE